MIPIITVINFFLFVFILLSFLFLSFLVFLFDEFLLFSILKDMYFLQNVKTKISRLKDQLLRTDKKVVFI